MIKECIKFLKKKKEGTFSIKIDWSGKIECTSVYAISNETAKKKFKNLAGVE